LIDTGAAVARQLQKRLVALDLLTPQHQAGSVRFWTNSQAMDAKQVIEALWGKSAEVESF
jgi:glutamate racemase